MNDKRKKMPDELGECDIGDVIKGDIYKYRLKIISKKHLYDDVFTYDCEYIEGPRKGEIIKIMSYFYYNKGVLQNDR